MKYLSNVITLMYGLPMGIKIERDEHRLEVKGGLSPKTLAEAIPELESFGPPGELTVTMMREVAGALQLVEEATADFHMIILTASDGKVYSLNTWITTAEGETAKLLRNEKADAFYALELSVRALNCLEGEGIVTVDALISRTANDLSEIRHLGDVTLKEIRLKLASKGLTLSGESIERVKRLYPGSVT